MLHVASRNDYSLTAGQAPLPADVKKPFDLVRNPAHRLNRPALVDRSGHGDTLMNRRVSQSRNQCAQLGSRGAIPFDPAIALFERQTRTECERHPSRVLLTQVAAENKHPLA